MPHEGESIMTASYPEADEKMIDDKAEADMETLIELIRAIRNIKAELGLQSRKVSAIAIASGNAAETVSSNAAAIKALARVEELTVQSSRPAPMGQCVSAHLPGIDLLVPVTGLIDVESELKKIKAEIASLEKDLFRVRGKLGNEQYLAKAPAEVVEKDRRIESELSEKLAKLQDRMKVLT